MLCNSKVAFSFQLANAGGAGDVDFGHEVSDDVDSREQQALVAKQRANLLADPQIAVRQRPDFCPRTGNNVAAVVAPGRDSTARS